MVHERNEGDEETLHSQKAIFSAPNPSMPDFEPWSGYSDQSRTSEERTLTSSSPGETA